MNPLTLRLPDETIEELGDEYEERGFRNRAVYIRHIITNRDMIFEDEGADTDATERLAAHDEQFADHDERLQALEDQARPFSWASRSSDSSP